LRALGQHKITPYSTILMSFIPEQTLKSWLIGDMVSEPFHLLLLPID
jgi:hypothetical protein